MREGFITDTQLGEALKEYEAKDHQVPINEILVDKGALTKRDVIRAAAYRKSYLGEILIETRVVSRRILDEVLREQRSAVDDVRLGDILLKYGIVNETHLQGALSVQYERKKSLSTSKGGGDSFAEVLTFLSSDNHPIVHDAMRRLLQQGPRVVKRLIAQMTKGDRLARPRIADVLGQLGDRRAGEALIDGLSSDDTELRGACAWSLLRLTRDAVPIHDEAKCRAWWGRNRKRYPDLENADWELRNRSFAELIDEMRATGRAKEGVVEFQSGKINWEGGRIGFLFTGKGRVYLKRNTRGTITLQKASLKAAQFLDLVDVIRINIPDELGLEWRIDRAEESCHDLVLHCGDLGRAAMYYQASDLYGILKLMAIENAITVIRKLGRIE